MSSYFRLLQFQITCCLIGYHPVVAYFQRINKNYFFCVTTRRYCFWTFESTSDLLNDNNKYSDRIVEVSTKPGPLWSSITVPFELPDSRVSTHSQNKKTRLKQNPGLPSIEPELVLVRDPSARLLTCGVLTAQFHAQYEARAHTPIEP